MDIVQILQFKKVAELEHITRAAWELRVAQPAISKTIHKLEEELDLTLFEREKRSIRLNQNGRILLRYAAQIEACISSMTQELRALDADEKQTISILAKTYGPFLTNMLQGFRAGNPSVCINLSVPGPGVSENEQDYDFIIYAVSPEKACPDDICLLCEELVLAVPRQNKNLTSDSVLLKSVQDRKFISLEKDMDLSALFHAYCKAAGFSPKVVLECSDPYTMSSLIEAGIGIAMIPEFSWGCQDDPELAFLHISEPKCRNGVYLRYSCRKKISSLCKSFREYVSAYSFSLQ